MIGNGSAELYVRSLLGKSRRQQQNEIIERLSTLVDDGTLASKSATVWGHQLPATRSEIQTQKGTALFDSLVEFRDWADQTGHSLSPTFEVRTVDATFRQEQYRSIILPTVLLAEYDDEHTVTSVTPHATESGVVSISDRLDELEAEPVSIAREHASSEQPVGSSAVAQAEQNQR